MPTRKNKADLKVVDEAETEVREKPERRKFTASYKARILGELDAAPPGGKAAILRREGLYSSAVQKWRAIADRKERETRRVGRKKNVLTAEVRKLRDQNMRLQKQLFKANKIIELQKKVSEILGVTLEQIEDDE